MDNLLYDLFLDMCGAVWNFYCDATFMGASLAWILVAVALMGIIIMYIVNVAKRPRINPGRRSKRE